MVSSMAATWSLIICHKWIAICIVKLSSYGGYALVSCSDTEHLLRRIQRNVKICTVHTNVVSQSLNLSLAEIGLAPTNLAIGVLHPSVLHPFSTRPLKFISESRSELHRGPERSLEGTKAKTRNPFTTSLKEYSSILSFLDNSCSSGSHKDSQLWDSCHLFYARSTLHS
jgi:hypothetical protein